MENKLAVTSFMFSTLTVLSIIVYSIVGFTREGSLMGKAFFGNIFTLFILAPFTHVYFILPLLFLIISLILGIVGLNKDKTYEFKETKLASYSLYIFIIILVIIFIGFMFFTDLF